ncbi:MAG: hypothetical protein ASARMPRED_009087 [Alectoria sarmentosa]|nr:MAG: hypothetical protein ASARMPRED_009087 [Alectoria sarmentosa]
MDFFKSLKGGHSTAQDKAYTSPPGPPPVREPTYQPPPGPPPPHQCHNHSAHGPLTAGNEYAPPPDPPPGWQKTPSETPPAPPDADEEPPPYHDWTVVPDNSLLPPPPALGHEKSPSSNANLSDADRAHEWCRINSMVRPHQPTHPQHSAVLNGDVRLSKPPEYKGDLLMPNTGLWKGSTRAGSKDSCLLTSSPIYFAYADSPLRTRNTKTIYFEVKVRSLGRGRGADESSIALGYCAMPYPTWRLPGWERGSLAVHGDDGRRYVNNTWGGKDFTSPIRAGDTVGLGMTFALADSLPGYEAQSKSETMAKVEVFLTRNGRRGESWDLHEELDEDEDLGIDGLDGQFDLYGAVGTFGGIDFDASFNSRDWLWQPR